MSIFGWVTRRVGGLAMLATVFLSYWVISSEAEASKYGYDIPGQQTTMHETKHPKGAGMWTVIFAYWCLVIHLCVFAFPIRSIYAMTDMTKGIKQAARSKSVKEYKLSHRRRGSSTSLSSSETLTSSKDSVSSSTTSSEAGDYEVEFYADGDSSSVESAQVVHAIIVPNYKEEVDTLRETLEVLASHPQARDTYDIYLGMEQREHNVELKAMNLVQEFVKKFRSIDFTLHPSDIPGESPGKGSNVAWAARKLSERYTMTTRKEVIITGIDADSHLSSTYFALLTSMHLSHPETANRTMYAAPIIFDRNAHNVPAIVRVGDILWASAGLSGLYRNSSIAPPTSVYSVPLELVDRVGGWDCDSEAIGEDLHMYLKCFFALNGHLIVRPIHSAVSQSNVKGNGGEGLTAIKNDVVARYKQALRHMWGSLDSGYAIRKGVELWKERKHTSRAFRPLHVALNNPTDITQSQLDNMNPEQTQEAGIFSDVTTDTLNAPHYERIFYLYHRMFEAHFLPLQMTILVVASTLYMWVTDGGPDPHGLNGIFTACNVLRTVGFAEVACLLCLYEKFHRVCVNTREKEMQEAGLSKGMNFSHRNLKKNLIDYAMVPLVAPIYGAFPLLEAQVKQFWTVDLVYTVSKKVTRTRSKSMIASDAV